MQICKVVDYFETQIGNIYILNFVPDDFIPRLGLKLKYLDTIVQITSMSLGSKDNYKIDGEKSVKKVWSCSLHALDKKEVKIPINTELSFVEHPAPK